MLAGLGNSIPSAASAVCGTLHHISQVQAGRGNKAEVLQHPYQDQCSFLVTEFSW